MDVLPALKDGASSALFAEENVCARRQAHEQGQMAAWRSSRSWWHSSRWASPSLPPCKRYRVTVYTPSATRERHFIEQGRQETAEALKGLEEHIRGSQPQETPQGSKTRSLAVRLVDRVVLTAFSVANQRRDEELTKIEGGFCAYYLISQVYRISSS